jgi:PAS domain S-box-containing protein
MLERTRRDGTTFIGQITTTPVLDEAGRLVGTISICSDVSAREEARAELERAHRTTAEALTVLSTLQEEAPVGFAFLDRDLRYVRVNQELAIIVGVPIEALVGRPVAEVAPELWEQLEAIYDQVLDSGQAVLDRPVTKRPSVEGGEARERLVSYYPVRIGDEVIGIGMIVHDITARLRAEGFRSAVMSQVVDGVYTQDAEGRLLYMNEAASKMLGWTEDELRGRSMHEAVHFQNTDGTPVDAEDCALLTEGPHAHLERSVGEAFTRKDGSTFPVAYSSVPLRTGSTVEGVLVVFRDVSEPGSSPNVIRVLIADNDRETSGSFQALLDRHEGIEVVTVARTSASTVEEAERLRPDVVLVNHELPDLDGVATAAIVKARTPATNVILMTEKYDDTVALASIDAGCAGVLDKSRAWVELVSAVRAAYHGETIISQAELQRVLSEARGREHRGRATRLTAREEEVLACMREGLPNSVVAERLGVSANTVRNHVQRILYKLNVHSKLEAVVLTSQDGVQQWRQ